MNEVEAMPPRLSPKTVEHIDSLFQPGSREAAIELLIHQCGNNLPFCEKSDEFQLERVRFAVLKLSEGDLEKLRKAISLAQTDWRDVLMAAGFGHNVNAYKSWNPAHI
jgi:hypothetical protein